MEFNQDMRLRAGQYINEVHNKSLIALHHTAGGSVTSTFKWWDTGDPRRIGTAYIVARDGEVFEVFPPDYWAWHLGVKDAEIEQRSIGIELANAGWLKPDGNGNLATWWGQKFEFTDHEHVHQFPNEWREHRWYEVYPQEQIDATVELVTHLCDRWDIPKVLPRKAKDDDADLRQWFDFEGVLHHAMLRKDKSDLTPQFSFRQLGIALGDPVW